MNSLGRRGFGRIALLLALAANCPSIVHGNDALVYRDLTWISDAMMQGFVQRFRDKTFVFEIHRGDSEETAAKRGTALLALKWDQDQKIFSLTYTMKKVQREYSEEEHTVESHSFSTEKPYLWRNSTLEEKKLKNGVPIYISKTTSTRRGQQLVWKKERNPQNLAPKEFLLAFSDEISPSLPEVLAENFFAQIKPPANSLLEFESFPHDVLIQDPASIAAQYQLLKSYRKVTSSTQRDGKTLTGFDILAATDRSMGKSSKVIDERGMLVSEIFSQSPFVVAKFAGDFSSGHKDGVAFTPEEWNSLNFFPDPSQNELLTTMLKEGKVILRIVGSAKEIPPGHDQVVEGENLILATGIGEAHLEKGLAQEDIIGSEDHELPDKFLDSISTLLPSKLSDLEKVRRLHALLRIKVKYLNSYDDFSIPEILQCEGGDCNDLSVLLAALLRKHGIPARVTVGYSLSLNEDGVFSADAHAWVEAYSEGKWHRLESTANPWSETLFDQTGFLYLKLGELRNTKLLIPMTINSKFRLEVPETASAKTERPSTPRRPH